MDTKKASLPSRVLQLLSARPAAEGHVQHCQALAKLAARHLDGYSIVDLPAIADIIMVWWTILCLVFHSTVFLTSIFGSTCWRLRRKLRRIQQ